VVETTKNAYIGEPGDWDTSRCHSWHFVNMKQWEETTRSCVKLLNQTATADRSRNGDEIRWGEELRGVQGIRVGNLFT